MTNSKDGLGHKDKYLDTSRKILSQKMLMCNMKALIFIIQNYDQCQFEKKIKCQGQNSLVPTKRSYHKEYLCEISKLWHSLFKTYEQGLNFKEEDRMTDRTKTICPPIFDLRGI